MWPSIDASDVVWIAKPALTEMMREADRMARLETGGVLMGYWVRPPKELDRAEMVVTSIIGPGPAAVHERWAFSPDHEHQVREMRRLYEASGRYWTYLGDWHTHPEGPARLSDRDRATLGRIASAADARAPCPVMALLVGGQPWTPFAWMAQINRPRRWWQRRVVTTPLHVLPYDAQE